MTYDIFDNQLGEYYEENITLEQAKETAIRFMERSMLEQGDDGDIRQNNLKLLHEMEQDKTFEDVAESLSCFDYALVEHKEIK